jgi:hypothetical protein
VKKRSVNYKPLRVEVKVKHIVQWITEFDGNNHITRVVGYCVRDTGSFGWPTLFRHEDKVVCEKVCDILNEEELTNVRRT